MPSTIRSFVSAFLLMAALRTASFAVPVVVNLAGAGPVGWDNGVFVGDGSPASLSSLNAPTGITTSPDGRIIVADFMGDRVRSIGQDGLVSTLAGTGWPGSQGGTSAPTISLWGPWSVAVRGTGIAFSDSFNSSIRTITNGGITQTAGIIGTVGSYYTGWAGFDGDNGPATSAHLNWPTGICSTSNGALYIADSWNNRIRKIDSSGTITTVAGNGWSDSWGSGRFSGDGGPATSACLNWPTAVAVDASGNLFIADTYNQRIRRVDAQTSTITTIAGNGQVGSEGDGGSAVDALLNHPQGLAFGLDGTLYISDSLNHRIRSVSGGIINAVAGTGVRGLQGDNSNALEARFNEPKGLAVSALGDLIVSDTGNNRIRMVLFGDTGVIEGFVRDARTDAPVPGASVVWSGLQSITDETGFYTLTTTTGARLLTARANAYGVVTESVNVSSGTTVNHDFLLPSGTVQGHVCDDAGHIVPGATVSSNGASTTCAQDGTFEIRLAPGTQTLTASKFGYGSGSQTVSVPYNANISVRLNLNRIRSVAVPLTYERDWISWNANPGDYTEPSNDYCFPAELLPESLSIFTVLTSGAPVDFQFPDKADGVNNTVLVGGQTINVPAGKYTGLNMLEAARFGGFTGTVTLNYSDGSTSAASLTFSDWAWNAIGNTLGPNETVAVACDHRHKSGSANSTPAVSIMHSTMVVDANKTLVSVKMPVDGSGTGSKDGYLFALSLDTVGSLVPYGDVNADGTVAVSDAASALANAAGLNTLTADQTNRADLAPLWPDTSFGDGSITVGDALRILRVALGN